MKTSCLHLTLVKMFSYDLFFVAFRVLIYGKGERKSEEPNEKLRGASKDRLNRKKRYLK